MKKTVLSVLVASLLCISSVTVRAAERMKPGLWSMTMKSDMFKAIPKAQLDQMRAMGVKMPQMDEGGMTNKVCITKEMAERDRPPEMDRKEIGCESKNFERSGSTYSLDVICDGKYMKGTGKVKGTFFGGESFTSTYDFKGVSHNQPVDQHMETTGKWLSSDCGAVAPAGGKK